MFCNQYYVNHDKLWVGMFQTSLINPSYYLPFLFISIVMNVTDIYRFHDCDLNSMRTWSPFLSYLVKLIYVQSFHILIILISSCSRHQPQSSLVWLLFATFDGWFVTLPLRVSHPNLGTRLFLGGKAVTVHVYVI
jgi:hypothetical protein